MITYPHELTKCEKCDSHYCMGCVGEDCPNCKLQEVAFYAISLENKLEAVKEHMKRYPDKTDDKYYIERHHPSPAGSHFFNSVLFLTHLETWHKQLEEILEAKNP